MYPDSDEPMKTERRKSRLPLDEQDKAISELTELTNMLMDRLQTVLTPTEPTDKAGEDRAVPVRSELAGILSDNNSRIQRVSRRLSNAIERLEV